MDTLSTNSPPRRFSFDVTSYPAACRRFSLRAGLYVIRVPAFAEPEIEGLTAVLVARLPEASDVEILSGASRAFEWIDAEGGAVVVRATSDRAAILITTFNRQDTSPLPLQILKLDEALSAVYTAGLKHDETTPGARGAPIAKPVPPANDLMVLLHIANLGDRRFATAGWMGDDSGVKHIEGLAIVPGSNAAFGDLQYRVLSKADTEGSWVPGGQFAGTRRRRAPLFGFAIRASIDGFKLGYSGRFLSGIESPVTSDGRMCTSTKANDPLVAIRIDVLPDSTSLASAGPLNKKPIVRQTTRIKSAFKRQS